MVNNRLLKDLFPNLWNELDDTKNKYRFGKDYVSFGSSILYWWICKKCGWSWETSPNNRTRNYVPNGKTGCLCCAGKTVREDNKLSTTLPAIAEEWDYIKNIGITPEDVSCGSGKKVWWLCSKCLFSWSTAVNHRKKGSGCPFCDRKKATKVNNFKVLFPSLAFEWDYEKNFPVIPDNVFMCKEKKFWWICSTCGYKWKTSTYNRVNKLIGKCPYCQERVATTTRNFGSLFPDIAKEWDHEKNVGITPDMAMPFSNIKVWWICSACSHSWKCTINSRTGSKHRCPECAFKDRASPVATRWLNMFCIDENQREKAIDCDGHKYKVDGFDPRTNTVYEFLGDYWHGNPKVFDWNKINGSIGKTFGDLYNMWIKKKSALEKCGYKVICIWESEFKNFEKQGVRKCE